MRFLMVTTFYPPYHFGGDATYVRALSRALVTAGHEVDVVCCTDAYRIAGGRVEAPAPVDDDGVKVHRLASRLGMLSPLISQQIGRPGLKASTLREVMAQPFDVVNFHNISLIGGPAVLGFSQAPVTLYTLHEHWLLCPTHIFWKNRTRACDSRTCLSCCLLSGKPPQLWRYGTAIGAAMRHVDRLIAPSSFTAEAHRAAGFAPPIEILPGFAAMALTPAQIGFRPPARPTFLYVGRVTRSKGIEAMAARFQTRPDYELVIIGDGDSLEDLRTRHAGDDNITLLGHVPQDELIEAYRAATALVLPSLAPESFGLTTVEAFACGTPAVVHDAGGAGEAVRASGAGYVYDTLDDAFAAMDQLAGDLALRRQMGLAAHAAYQELYSLKVHLARYLRIVDNVATAGGRQSRCA
ncbi:MAG: glycosyltransferase family 4 protein [Alphaproteobacteria bacterium]